jgi:hypothetical protein
MKTKFYKMAIALGVCADVKAGTKESDEILESIEYTTCDMPDCNEPSVRIGVYPVDKNITEYRQLCERHKNIGIWSDTGGWDIE